MFVVLEGLDASGKSTQAEILAKSVGAVQFKYPNRRSPLGRIIDRWLRGQVTLSRVTRGGNGQIVTATEDPDAYLALQGLLLANKVEVQESLLHALRGNHGWVVADRYTPSARAYGTADGLDDAWLEESHRPLIEPDLYILLDVTVDEAIRRKGGVAEHYEANRERLERAWKKYRDMATSDRGKHQWEVVNSMKPKDEVARNILIAIARHRKPHHNGHHEE